mmetsp:Transcript_136302/g.236999  ORF Transcript_136302/g.236999 Transcript_136302/m.236999 type:complete len:457 (-) Transcript_136302:74-1444(-)
MANASSAPIPLPTGQAAVAAAATGVQWATEAEVARAVAIWLRPAYLLILFVVGWALDVETFNRQKLDYATVLGLSRDELREPRFWICVAVALGCMLAAVHAVILHHGSAPDILWAPATVYLLLLMGLVFPLPRALERRLGAWRKPLRLTLWRCFWPAWRETSFLEVIIADGLTSLAKSFYDLGLSACVACRTSGSPWALAVSLFTGALDLRTLSTDMASSGAFSESGSPMKAVPAVTRLRTGKTLQLASEECSKSVVPYLLWTVPALIRARQCIMSARFAATDQARSQHYANLAKYMSALPPMLFIFCVAHAGPSSWPLDVDDFETLWAFASICNAVFSVMWDLVFDWGLLHPSPCVSKIGILTGLRPTLLLRPAIPVYHCAVTLNLVGRTLWSLRWSQQCAVVGGLFCSNVQAISEVLRRCLWNVLRVEWQLIKCELHSVKHELHADRSRAPVPV